MAGGWAEGGSTFALKVLRVAFVVSMATTLPSSALAQASQGADPPIPPSSERAKGPRESFRHRALLGLTFGSVSSALNDSPAAMNGGLDFGLEERFTRLFSLAARGRITTWNYGWADKVGYQRSRWDLGVEPRLWTRPSLRYVGEGRGFFERRVEGYAGVGSGVTVPYAFRRAYHERIDGSPGYYLSACIGGTLGNDRAALFTEISYLFHATLEPRTDEEREFADHSLLFSIGLVAGFGVLE